MGRYVLRRSLAIIPVLIGVTLLVFAAITLALVWLIHRISLHRVLRLGEM